jgi:hypothetical protein
MNENIQNKTAKNAIKAREYRIDDLEKKKYTIKRITRRISVLVTDNISVVAVLR